MLDQVDAAELVGGGDAPTDGALDQHGDQVADHEGVDRDGDRTDGLAPELVDAAAVEQARHAGGAVRICEQADQHRAEQATDEVDAHHVERVVVAELVLQADGVGASRAGDAADEDRTDGADRAGCGGDRHQTGHHARGRTERGRVTVTEALHQQPGEHGGRGGHQGVHPRHRGGGARTEGRAGVEAEPAEPQQAGTEHHQGHVVRPHRLGAEADPGAEHEREGQTRDTGVDVNRGATGEVEGAEPVGDPAAVLTGEAVEAEHPAGHWEVDQNAPQHGEQRPAAERRAVGDRTRHQGDRDDGEAGLEGHERHGRQRARDRVGAHQALQAEVLERVAEDAEERRALVSGCAELEADRVAERHAVAEEHPQDADRAHADEAHHHHVENALGPDHATVEEGETGGHQQHQSGGGENPGGVAGVDFKHCHGRTFGDRCFRGVRTALRVDCAVLQLCCARSSCDTAGTLAKHRQAE